MNGAEKYRLQSSLRRAWLRRIQQEYETICCQYRLCLRPPLFVLGDSGTVLGTWNSVTRELTLSRWLVGSVEWSVTVQILKHEMAHQICTDLLACPGDAHGEAFRRAGDMVGLADGFCGARIDCAGLRSLRTRNETGPGNDRRRILARAEKLFALAASDNEHEAALAMERAWQLLQRYNLEPTGPRGSFRRLVIVTNYKRMPRHLKQICVLLQDYFFVRVICASTYLPGSDREVRSVELFGRPANVDVAAHCYHFLVERTEQLWQANRARFRPHARRARTSYLTGLVAGFVERLAGPVRKGTGRTAPATCLPVPLHPARDPALQEYVARFHPRLVRRSGGRISIQGHAYADARRQGRTIVLHRVIPERNSGQGLLE